MIAPRLLLSAWIAAAIAVGTGGCGNPDSHNDATAGAHPEGGHVHQPKYGGRLVELGNHQGNLELVLDAAAGRLALYSLDAHAENFVRLPLTEISLVAETPGGSHPLVLKPVGNAATGEKPGDTSQFEVTADWIRTTPAFTVRIPELTVQATTYRDLVVRLPQ